MKKILFLLLLTVAVFADIGTIMATNGEAQVKRASKLLTVKSGMSLQKGDELITQKQTQVQVMLNDDTVITIGPDSSFSFLDYFFDGSKKSTIQMQANRGFFRSVTGQIGKIAPERFKVKTQLATIGIRGTDFSAQITKDQALYECYRGEITVAYAQVQKAIPAGNKILLHLDGLTIQEFSEAAFKSKSKFKELVKKHSTQASIGQHSIADMTENKIDTEKIKFNCEH